MLARRRLRTANIAPGSQNGRGRPAVVIGPNHQHASRDDRVGEMEKLSLPNSLAKVQKKKKLEHIGQGVVTSNLAVGSGSSPVKDRCPVHQGLSLFVAVVAEGIEQRHCY